MSAADIATALGGGHRSGAWWRCRRPVHGSRGATLALCDGERGVIGRYPEQRPFNPTIQQPARSDDIAGRIAAAERVWKTAQNAVGSPMVQYLAGRGISIAVPPCLRWTPRCWHSDRRRSIPARTASPGAVMTPRSPSHAELRAGRGMWGSKPAVREGAAPRQPRSQLKLARLSSVTNAGSLLAYLDLEHASGLVTREWRLMRDAGGKLWIAAPSIKATDRKCEPAINDRGKPVYKNFVDFKDRAVRDKFTEQVINLVRCEHPDIVGDEA